MTDLLDWKLQFQDYKALVLTGSTEEDRTEVIKAFAKRCFDNMIHINLKNNSEIREYINTHPTGRDAYLYIEHAVHDMIVPMETLLIFNNADSLDREACREYAKNFFEPEDMSFLAVVGDFSEEELEKMSEYCTILHLPAKE